MGDLGYIDIILFAGIAAFLVFRLRSVLGKRTGFEKKTAQRSKIIQEAEKKEYKKSAPELPESLSKLKTVYEVMNDFNHKDFLDGAKIAFETIINAFNKGDKKILKDLLTKEVYSSFEEAIESKQTDPDYQFYSLNIERVTDVSTTGGLVKVSIKFISEQFKNEDETTVVKKEDTWTFEKSISSKNPNWLLSST